MVGIYWNNHHHLMQVVHTIDGRTLWANMHLLFWLSLTPLTTAWLGEAGVETGPVAAYAIVLLGCAIAYTLLTLALLALHESGSQLAQAIGRRPQGQALARRSTCSRSRSRSCCRGSRSRCSSPSRSSGSCPTAASSACSTTGSAAGRRDDAQRLRVGHLDDVARTQLAPAAPFRLAVDGDRRASRSGSSPRRRCRRRRRAAAAGRGR